MIANTDDTTTPVAHACKTRPRSSTGKTGAVAQTREPTTNRPRPSHSCSAIPVTAGFATTA